MQSTLNVREPEGYDLLRDASGLLELGRFSLTELRGDDRKGWLQGQATNDLRSLTSGSSNAFCVCTPTGQALSVCDVWALPERILTTCESSTTAALLERWRAQLILEDVQIAELTPELTMMSVQGPTATRDLTEFFALPTLDAAEIAFEGADIVCLRSNRTGLGGWDLWVPHGAKKAISKIRKAFGPISVDAYEVARLEAGVPLFGHDIDSKTLPPELGPQFEARHISYSKGCYVGQEVLMRLHSRGHTNRTWMGLSSEHPLTVGAPVGHRARPDAGVVTSAYWSPDFGHIGAAMLRAEAAHHGESVTVTTESGSVEAEVRAMPLLRLD